MTPVTTQSTLKGPSCPRRPDFAWAAPSTSAPTLSPSPERITWVWKEGTFTTPHTGDVMVEHLDAWTLTRTHELYVYDAPILSIIEIDGAPFLEALHDDDDTLGLVYLMSPMTPEDVTALLQVVEEHDSVDSGKDIQVCRDIQSRSGAWLTSYGTEDHPYHFRTWIETLPPSFLMGKETS